MFDFFIALFGGLFMGKKVASDNRSVKQYERKAEDSKKMNEDFRVRVGASHELEQEIAARILSGTETDAIYTELEEDLQFILGDASLRRKFAIPTRPRHGGIGDYRDPAYWALQLLLAHKGKVSWNAYLYGFPIGGEAEKDRNIKICQRIEYNLQANGVDVRLVLKPGTKNDNLRWNPCGKNIIFEHQLYWEIDPEQARLW